MKPSSPASVLLPALQAPLLLFFLTLQNQRTSAAATTYNVTPFGDDRRLLQAEAEENRSSSPVAPKRVIHTLSQALRLANAGDTIFLGDGEYHVRLVSARSGREGYPITIVGGVNATIKSTGADPVQINHSWITIKGFSVDGTIHSGERGGKQGGEHVARGSYAEKCVRVDGIGIHGRGNPLKGFVMKGMTIRNCGGECIRLKNFVQNAKIIGNTLEYCGQSNFPLPHGDPRHDKNGEGVYIGTSSEQTGKDAPLDRCNKNLISGNTIATHGNECVEVKEGSSRNIIEYNVCSDQLDVNSGCFGSRGDENIFRYNEVFDCKGAGVRLGGHIFRDYQFGQGNKVCGNSFNRVTVGSIRVMIDQPQGVICSNSCREGSCYITGNDRVADIEATWDVECKLRQPCDGL